MEGAYECGNEFSGSIKRREFLALMTTCFSFLGTVLLHGINWLFISFLKLCM